MDIPILKEYCSLKKKYQAMWIPRDGLFYYIPAEEYTYAEYAVAKESFATDPAPTPQKLSMEEFQIFTYEYDRTTSCPHVIDHKAKTAALGVTALTLMWNDGVADPATTWMDRARAVVGHVRVVVNDKTYWIGRDEAIIANDLVYWPDTKDVHQFGYGTSRARLPGCETYAPTGNWAPFFQVPPEPIVVKVPYNRPVYSEVRHDPKFPVPIYVATGVMFVPEVPAPLPKAVELKKDEQELRTIHADAIDLAVKTAEGGIPEIKKLKDKCPESDSEESVGSDAEELEPRPSEGVAPDSPDDAQPEPPAPKVVPEDVDVSTQAPSPWWQALAQSVFEISGVEIDKGKSTVYSRTILCMRNATTAATFIKYLVQAIAFVRNILYESVTGVPWDAREHATDYATLDQWILEVFSDNVAPHRILAIATEARIMSVRVPIPDSQFPVTTYPFFTTTSRTCSSFKTASSYSTAAFL